MEYDLFKKQMKEIEKDYLLMKLDLKTYFNALADKLEESEKLKDLLVVNYKIKNYLVALTEKRIILLSKPLIGSLKYIELPFNKIKSINFKKGFFSNGMSIEADETYELKSVTGDGQNFISIFNSLR